MVIEQRYFCRTCGMSSTTYMHELTVMPDMCDTCKHVFALTDDQMTYDERLHRRRMYVYDRAYKRALARAWNENDAHALELALGYVNVKIDVNDE